MKAHVRIREQAIGGTPEVYVGDPDGIVIQLNDSSYGGGAGPLGDKYSRAPESAPADGLLAVRDYNHVTSFVPDQRRTVRFYQKLFQMPIDTYQGPLPILRVGTGNQSLAFVGAADRQSPALIDHVCFAMDDFNPGRILATLAGYGVAPCADERRRPAPLKSYVTMRMPDRGGAGRYAGTLLHRSGRHTPAGSRHAILLWWRLSRGRAGNAQGSSEVKSEAIGLPRQSRIHSATYRCHAQKAWGKRDDEEDQAQIPGPSQGRACDHGVVPL